MTPSLLAREERLDLCREPDCEAHTGGEVPCPVKAVERAVEDKLTAEMVEEVSARGLSAKASKAWQVYTGSDSRIHRDEDCAKAEASSQVADGILTFLHDSDGPDRLYLITADLGMPPTVVPDQFREQVPTCDICTDCAPDLRNSLPEDVNNA